MGWKEFAASVIGDLLDWPIVVLVIVMFLLGPIRRLIERIKNAAAKGFGGELSVELAEIEEKAAKALDDAPKRAWRWWRRKATPPAHVDVPTAPPDAAPTSPPDEPASSNSDATDLPYGLDDEELLKSPAGLVLGAYYRVEKKMLTLRDLALPEQPTRIKSGNFAALQLKSAGVISDSLFESFKGLTNVRNEIVHAHSPVDRWAAARYLVSAEAIEGILDRGIDNHKSG